MNTSIPMLSALCSHGHVALHGSKDTVQQLEGRAGVVRSKDMGDNLKEATA